MPSPSPAKMNSSPDSSPSPDSSTTSLVRSGVFVDSVMSRAFLGSNLVRGVS